MWKKRKEEVSFEVSEDRKPKVKKRKKLKWLIVVILLILIMILFFAFKSCSEPLVPTSDDTPIASAADRDVAVNPVKVKSPEYEKYEKEMNDLSQQASIMYTPSPIIGGANATGILIWYPNIGDAAYITVDIYAPGYDNPIYSSPLIPKDSAIQVDELTTKLPKGTYKCKVITTAIDEKDGQRVAKPNKPVTAMEITIAK